MDSTMYSSPSIHSAVVVWPVVEPLRQRVRGQQLARPPRNERVPHMAQASMGSARSAVRASAFAAASWRTEAIQTDDAEEVTR